MRRLAARMGLIAGLAGLAPAAHAQVGRLELDGQGQRRISVAYADLDLNSPAGAAVLVRRVRSAAKEVCGFGPSSPLDLGGSARFAKCVDQTSAAALVKLNKPQVASAYAVGRY